jgi:hypothetical protein
MKFFSVSEIVKSFIRYLKSTVIDVHVDSTFREHWGQNMMVISIRLEHQCGVIHIDEGHACSKRT